MKHFLTYLLVFFLIGCNETPIEPEPISGNQCQYLKINGTNESFCGDIASGVFSHLETSDSLYIYREEFSPFKNSENYKAASVAFAHYIPDSSEFEFFYDLIKLLPPESFHDLDIKKPGGFAIEVWDYSGEYYSSELGPQTKGGKILIRNTNTYMAGPVFNSQKPNMTISFENREPILLWNSDNTLNLEVEINRVDFLVIN